jgi:Flp pilus assembly pilin Flp
VVFGLRRADQDHSIRVVMQILARLVREEEGQDIIEYALLAAFIGTVGIVAWQNIAVGIKNAYLGWDSGLQTLSSCTPDPGGGGC